jgi:Leucine-rich repeat (LRR) protein
MKKISTSLLFIAAIYFFKPNFLTAQVNVQDSLALVALYNSTDGPHWNSRDNWLTSTPVSSWYGIILNGNRVTSLFLESNNLNGNIPDELGNLTSLQKLYLYSNKLTGTIPASLGSLTNLQHLYLFNNQLSGTIPAEIGNLINLEDLELASNQLNGPIPAEIGNLKNLYYLRLYRNNLSSNIPIEIGNLTNLKDLELGINKLSGNIPPELSKLNNLYGLDLSYNQLSGSIPHELGDLLKLEYLDLSFNQLTGSIPAELGKIIKLQRLSLDHNQLTDTIPSELHEIHLKTLYLNNNRLRGRVIQFYKSLRNGYINLTNNNFTFAGMLFIERNFRYKAYSSQANIPINKNGNILSVYAGGTYAFERNTFKWYKGSTLVATITGDSTFTPTQSGNYHVTVTNSVATQLKLHSDTIYYNAGNNLIASKLNNNSPISLYPNPAKNFTTLSFSAEGKYLITITNVSGKILQTKTGVAIKGSNIIRLDVSKYASGIYLLTVVDGKNKNQTSKLNKE